MYRRKFMNLMGIVNEWAVAFSTGIYPSKFFLTSKPWNEWFVLLRRKEVMKTGVGLSNVLKEFSKRFRLFVRPRELDLHNKLSLYGSLLSGDLWDSRQSSAASTTRDVLSVRPAWPDDLRQLWRLPSPVPQRRRLPRRDPARFYVPRPFPRPVRRAGDALHVVEGRAVHVVLAKLWFA